MGFRTCTLKGKPVDHLSLILLGSQIVCLFDFQLSLPRSFGITRCQPGQSLDTLKFLKTPLDKPIVFLFQSGIARGKDRSGGAPAVASRVADDRHPRGRGQRIPHRPWGVYTPVTCRRSHSFRSHPLHFGQRNLAHGAWHPGKHDRNYRLR